jgi:hypothetical protein
MVSLFPPTVAEASLTGPACGVAVGVDLGVGVDLDDPDDPELPFLLCGLVPHAAKRRITAATSASRIQADTRTLEPSPSRYADSPA